MIKRVFDFTISLLALIVLSPILLIITLWIVADSEGPAIFWSRRFGVKSTIFMMPKFRSMRIGTPQVATHLLQDGQSHLTRVGGFLRRTSLDELPQLWSVLKGDMSLVGPRPALFNQYDLIEQRVKHGVAQLKPGITGWAQVNGRDELSIDQKVKLEAEYMTRQTFGFDLSIIFLTVGRVFGRSGISH